MNKPKKPIQAARKMGRPTLEQAQALDEKVKAEALELFLDFGFDATSMEAIANAAGITKRSLYARYSDKGELFAEVLRWSKNEWILQESTSPALKKKRSLEAELMAVGDALLQQTLSSKFIKLNRIAAAKAEDFPEDIRQNFKISLSPRIQTIARILERHESAGEIEVKDIGMAAELFLGLITGVPAKLAAFGTIRDAKFEKKRIRYAVEVFVKGVRKST